MKLTCPTLQKGDVVDILAPAYGVHERDLKKICEYVESIGLVPRVPDNFMQGDLIASAPAKVRFEQLYDALSNDISKAVWCVKGGSGSPQLIPYLEQVPPLKKQKLFIAFSDITSIHFFLNQKWGWQTVHGPILWQIARDRLDKESQKEIENLIFGREFKTEFPLEVIGGLNHSTPPEELNAEAIIGGNLKLVQCSIATSWQIEAKDKILLFEDVNEKPYQIDRILTHILQSKLCEGATAIIFGDFEGGDDEMDIPLIDKILTRFAEEIKIPTFKVSGIGHTRTNYPVIFGRKTQIKHNKKLNYLLKFD